MGDFFVSLKKVMADFTSQEARTDKAKQLALMAVTLHKFIEIICDELERAKYSSNEFVANLELYLYSVTPMYRKELFEQLLAVLQSIDAKFEDSVFFFSLCCLREMICHDLGLTKYEKLSFNQNHDQISSMFLLHTIEVLINTLAKLKKDFKTRSRPLNDLRGMIDGKFDDIVVHAVEAVISPAHNIH